ncbi:Zn-dependent exopeptidase [Tilletiaria anomala UBC 951]|uniref:Peptide hydrolase n=1 Tax=Tilletiaria anomala (strain ATCC 24038 / CBS 436.72 / UBC 951) TaxID=1037660 RepID=A0A066WFQ4_TILAU|nr:Zn-dependent exopeptidase [Tilletiaria anomala UBC 951]KDN49585.1 Zn-dependent exopeptidase [Tilletiaria anomala UBC 951]
MKLSTSFAAVALIGLTPGISAAPTSGASTSLKLDWTTNIAGGASAVISALWGEVKHAVTWRMIQTSPDQEPYWTTELGKHLLFMRGVKFVDVTDHADFPVVSTSLASTASKRPWPTKAAHADFLKTRVFSNITADGPRANLKKFTSFRNRYYRSATGRESQLWLLSKVKEIASTNPQITVSEFEHDWQQNSIIMHFPSNSSSQPFDASKSIKKEHKPVVILGAHLDSTAFIPFLPAPGGDDDGSGTATLLEALRALLAVGWQPQGDYDLEWHWYSAEEGGLLGSQEIVKSYVQRGREVRAMLQQDMTAFLKPGTAEKIALVADFTDPKLTSFLEMLVTEYLDIPAAQTKIGYAASDHASWMKAGIPAAFAVEGLYDDCNLRNIHTSGDTTTAEGYSFDHMLKFVRLTTAFAVELAGQQA